MIKNQGRAAMFLAGALLVTGLISPDAALAGKGKQCKTSAKCSRTTGNKNDIVNTAQRDGSFKTLSDALCCTGLSNTLHAKGPFTVFAPTDEAFAKLPKDQKEAIAKDAANLKYHVVKGNYSAADLKQKRSITTVQGESLMLNTKDDALVVDGAVVTKGDIQCSNGVIHVIDFVLVPERGK
ncbi:MAG: fasciclin domain-containing protein [Candidatus Melainabacteria bacterium]|nr:fasciclin domain-containing protein [Candidatus Melainabacteria bacterium]